MDPKNNIEFYAENPFALVELCREVLGVLEERRAEPSNGEEATQLLEISKTIKRLEKAGVSIPDALRHEKSRLITAVAASNEGLENYRKFLEGLAKVVSDAGADLKDARPRKTKRNRKKRGPQTDRMVLRQNIIEALERLGGRADVNDVLDEIAKKLEGQLLPGDLDWLERKKLYQWQYMCHWQAYHLRQEGVFKESTQRGIWELNR